MWTVRRWGRFLSYPTGSVAGVDEALAVVEQAVDRCLVVPLWARSPEAVVGYLDRVQALEQQLAALKLALIRDVDGRGVALEQGAASLVSWLRDRYRVSGGAANRAVKLARVVDSGRRRCPRRCGPVR